MKYDPPAVAIGAQGDGGPADVVRRAPFADNPHVGARGQRTQQRILDAVHIIEQGLLGLRSR